MTIDRQQLCEISCLNDNLTLSYEASDNNYAVDVVDLRCTRKRQFCGSFGVN